MFSTLKISFLLLLCIVQTNLEAEQTKKHFDVVTFQAKFDPTNNVISIRQVGPWWWSSGQRACFLFRRSKFESLPTVTLCKIWVWINENKQVKLVGAHSSVVTSAPSDLWPRFEPRANHLLCSFQIYFILLHLLDKLSRISIKCSGRDWLKFKKTRPKSRGLL